ncbi:MAG: Uma2 family endonuclease, partial [Planctomycetota bacterium]
PEICVEVVSPSNTDSELRHKRQLYFDAGAIECWTCDQQGQMAFYQNNNPDTPHNKSKLCPEFPYEISG